MSVPLHKIQRRAEMFLDSYPKTCHHPVQQLLSDAETVCWPDPLQQIRVKCLTRGQASAFK